MDILSALRVLRSATTDILESHHQEVLETLEDLRNRLSIQPSPDNQPRRGSSVDSDFSVNTAHGSDSLCHTNGFGSESHAESSESSTSSNHIHGATESDTSTGYASEIESAPDSTSRSSCQPSDWTKKLLATSNKDIRWLYEYSRGTTNCTIQNKRKETSDERIKDILRVEGRPSKENRIFRALAQRSMGIQFTEIQRKRIEHKEHERQETERENDQHGNNNIKLQTRVDELVESICASDPGLRKRIHKRSNDLSKDLDKFNYNSYERKIMSKGIRDGFKRLVIEKLFAQRLEKSGRPAKPSGISAFTALGVTAFDRLLYEEIPCFLDELFRLKVKVPLDSTQDCLGTRDVQLPDALVHLSQWFDKFQSDYDDTYKKSLAESLVGDAVNGEQRAQKRQCTSRADPAILCHQHFENMPSRYDNAEVGEHPIPRNSVSSTQSMLQTTHTPAEATNTVSEVSAMSIAPLPTNRTPPLGNWDRDYDVLPVQPARASRTHFIWGNRGNTVRNFTFSNMNEQQSLTGSALWGNWDQDYDIASLGTEQTTSSNFPWGNWDQNYESVSSGLHEEQPVPQRDWDQTYAAASLRAERTASSTFADANWDTNDPAAAAPGSQAHIDQSQTQPWGNWDRDYSAPSGASWTTSDPIAMLQI